MTIHGDRQFHAQRLELIGTMACGVAHDLNNQLTVILNHLDFALRGLGPHDPVRASLTDVQRAAYGCAEMLGSLVGFGARTHSRFQRLELEPVLSETARFLRRIVPSNIQITLVIDPTLQPVVADATQIQQVLINLSINARDAMPDGGSIEIVARNEPDRVALIVRDTGCGIPAATRDYIFEPFFTTKSEMGGSGLGLAMVAAILEDHGGAITVDSQPNRGTCFHLFLPVASDVEKKIRQQ
ncbi:MAG: sensor protein [Bryobacterales bacterium]|nr:sensor protein [Bryobacterales bacterium]